ncbi:TolC family outer membrane protein [Mongoliimonas terrestris]|uniref:TolC family outer membrane protein n=1 Tax=Mongoliimonas terrestris TaxID=1709001 RepID=UPI000B0702FB|nr:TolC family outer membrane protein [Mongoliimonas terrestris]
MSKRILLVSAALVAMLTASPLRADTLSEALAAAYANNPTLNAQRAATRAVDEEVPQALSGYRPSINAFANLGASNSRGFEQRSASAGITITQPIFSGFRTVNGTKAAEASVKASRESLRNTEQNTLLDAVEAYMNVVRDGAILSLLRENVSFLEEQVRASRDRFQVGEGTRTDVAQSEARLASASADVSAALANLESSRGVYIQVIGRAPKNLKPAKAVDKLLPRSLDAAIGASRTDHPAILAAVYNADTASFNVKIIEGELLPSVSLEATAQRDWEDGFQASTGNSAQVFGRLSIPIYEGGQVYSRVRQAKETLGQRKIEIDSARDQVQAALVGAWSGLESARSQSVAARSQVEAARLALEGVVEEQRVGQRTTLDVLNAQAEVISARITQVQAERDQVVASYSVLASIGRLSSQSLGLQVATYKPEAHYQQVRDKWIGLRTPDGR